MENIHVVNLSAYTQPEVTENPREGWVEYGSDNDYYNWLIARFKNSATNNAVIHNISRLVYGQGLYAKDAHRRPNDYAQMKMLFSKQTLRAVIMDLKLLGSGCFQVITEKGSVTRVEHLPMNLLRPAKCNEKGVIEGWFYSDNWEDTKKFPPKFIPIFDGKKDGLSVLVFGNYSVGMKYFHAVDYEGALDYCVLEEEIAAYLINETKNSFSPTTIINFNNGVPPEEERRKQADQVIAKATGSYGKKVIVAFNDDETKKTTIDSIPLNDAPAHYEYLSTEARNKILAGHNVTSPMLVGISPDGQGFSSNADEIEVASKYFYNAVIKPFQDMVIDAVDSILAVNGIKLDLFFRRLNLLEDLEAEKQAAEETSLSSHKSVSDIINEYGEDEDLEGWELVDEREVDYDKEDDFDAQLKEWQEKLMPKTSLLSKIWNFVSTGTANPNAKSSQDKEVDGFFFKVRYEYTGNPTPERDFCKAMMSRNKLYRKEDITRMSSQIVNAGFGEGGADTYDIFKYKGGPRCHHKWIRKTYISTSAGIDVNNPNAKTVSTNKAQKFGYRVDNPTEVAMMPNDMPLKGFSPNNPNLPSDVR